MIDVWKKIYYSDVGSGDYAMVTIRSLDNRAILLGNDSINRDAHLVVYKDNINALINALQELRGLL